VDLQLQGKLVLVSGSTSGIGLAIASAFARESATVIVNGRQANRVAEVVAEIRKRYPNTQAREFVGDLNPERSLRPRLSRSSSKEFGPVRS
jgi:NAD(P)-dependent dehydrogenase (short-subunit alcohol dehydrogenase family)